MKLPLTITDAGRAKSKRPKERQDCTVRAMATACGISYDDAHVAMAKGGRRYGRAFDLPKWFRHQGYLRLPGRTIVFRWIGFPSVKGRKRMTQAEFVAKYPQGRFIAGTPGHVEAYIDGTLYDDQRQRLSRCFYGVWQVIDAGPDATLWLVKGQRPGAPQAKRLGVVPGCYKHVAEARARDWFGHLKVGELTVERIDG